MQLLWIIGIANAVSMLAVVALSVLAWRLPEDQSLPWRAKLVSLSTIFLALAVSLLAESALQRGSRSSIWPDSLLATPRKILSHPLLFIVITVMGIASIAAFCVLPLHSASLGTLFLAVPLSLSRINFALNSKSGETFSSLSAGSALYPAKPLHSDQWRH